MSTFPKISVIVPVYNTEVFLSRCIKSILANNYPNIEIIAIDDGSTDHSNQLLHKLKDNSENITIYNQTNQGQGVARNVGLAMAKGDFIAFIDSDDRVLPDMFTTLINFAVKYDCDVVSCRLAFEGNGKTKIYGNNFDTSILTGKEIIRDALHVKNFYMSPVNKIYKREFLIRNQIRFPSLKKNEDLAFSIDIACCAKKVGFINTPYYYAYRRKESTTRNFGPMNILDTERSLVIVLERLNDKQVNFEEEFAHFYLKTKINLFVQACLYSNYHLVPNAILLTIFDHTFMRYIHTPKNVKTLPLSHRTIVLLIRVKIIIALRPLLRSFRSILHIY